MGLAFELTAVLDVIALRQLDVLSDPLLNVVDHAAQVPPGDVALDDDSALDVLPHDEVRATVFLNRCDRRQWNLATVWCLDLRHPNRVELRRFVQGVANDQRKGDLSLKNLTHGMADARRLQGLRDCARREPLTRGRCRIDAHLQCRNVGLGLCREVDDSLDLRHLTLHLAGQLAEGRKIVAEDLDGDVRAGAGEHVVDAMRDGLADRDVGAREQ